jgi:Fe-S-cluster containining protein
VADSRPAFFTKAWRQPPPPPRPQEPLPSNGCRLCRAPCCRLEVEITEDEARSGKWRFTRAPDGAYLLAKKSPFDDRCLYLGDDGRCTIYGDRPSLCSRFDCTGDGRFEFLK